MHHANLQPGTHREFFSNYFECKYLVGHIPGTKRTANKSIIHLIILELVIVAQTLTPPILGQAQKEVRGQGIPLIYSIKVHFPSQEA